MIKKRLLKELTNKECSLIRDMDMLDEGLSSTIELDEDIEEGFVGDVVDYVKDKRAFKGRSQQYNQRRQELTRAKRLDSKGNRRTPLKSGEKRNQAVDAEMKDLHHKLFTDPNRNKKKKVTSEGRTEYIAGNYEYHPKHGHHTATHDSGHKIYQQGASVNAPTAGLYGYRNDHELTKALNKKYPPKKSIGEYRTNIGGGRGDVPPSNKPTKRTNISGGYSTPRFPKLPPKKYNANPPRTSTKPRPDDPEHAVRKNSFQGVLTKVKRKLTGEAEQSYTGPYADRTPADKKKEDDANARWWKKNDPNHPVNVEKAAAKKRVMAKQKKTNEAMVKKVKPDYSPTKGGYKPYGWNGNDKVKRGGIRKPTIAKSPLGNKRKIKPLVDPRD